MADKAALPGKIPLPGRSAAALPGAPPADQAALPGKAPPETAAPEALARLIRTLNLPPDALSAALLSFARHFSLPLDPALITRLRREVLSLKVPREAAALAAAAAADKGLELSPQALEDYAAALDPGPPREDHSEGGRDGRDHPGAPNQEELKKYPAQIEAEKPLLAILNRIPGKNGKNWIVYPFQFSSGDLQFRVSVRLWSGDETGKGAVRAAVDIAGGARRWLFILNHPEAPEKGTGGAETWVSLAPPPSRRERDRLIREIEAVLGGRVRFLPDQEPLFADALDGPWPLVDEKA